MYSYEARSFVEKLFKQEKLKSYLKIQKFMAIYLLIIKSVIYNFIICICAISNGIT